MPDKIVKALAPRVREVCLLEKLSRARVCRWSVSLGRGTTGGAAVTVVSDSWFRRGMNIFIPAEYSSLYQVYFRRTEMLNRLFALCTKIPFTVALTSGNVRGKFFKASAETSCKGELAFLQSLKSLFCWLT